MRGLVQALLATGLMAWAVCGVCAWILRDGLGPNAVESEGWEALTRSFWTFYWGPVFLVLVVAKVLWSRCADHSGKQVPHEAEAS